MYIYKYIYCIINIYIICIYIIYIHVAYIYICIQVLRISVYLKPLCIFKRSYTILPNDLSTVYRHKICFPKYSRAFQGRVYDRLVGKSRPNLVESVLVDT